MKKFFFSLFIAIVAILSFSLVSCEKNELEDTPTSVSEVVDDELNTTQTNDDVGLLQTKRAGGMYYSFEVTESPFGVHYQGRPNESQYKFYLANPSSDIENVEVIFTSPFGGTYGDFWMEKNSNGNFFKQKTLSQEGKYIVKYKIYYSSGKSKLVSPSIGYVINSNVPPLDDHYPHSDETIDDPDEWGFFKRECTSYVAWRVNQMWGTETFNNFMFGNSPEDKLSDAGKWYERLTKSNEYLGNNNPQAGDIMCWKDKNHVAFVHKVENGRVYYSDYNYYNDFSYHSNNPTIAAAKAVANFVHVKNQQ